MFDLEGPVHTGDEDAGTGRCHHGRHNGGMGMSKGQKQRIYGAGEEPSPRRSGARGGRTSGPASARASSAASRAAGAARAMNGDAAAARREPRSALGVIIGVLTVIALLLFAYVYVLVLPSMGAAYGLVVPELRFTGFGREEIARSAAALGADGRENYRLIHRSSGLLLPLFLALAWFAMIGQSLDSRRARWAMWAVPLLYAVVHLGGDAAVDAALADPASGPVILASVLVVARWVLLLTMLAQALWMLVHLVRSKVDAFSRGELPGQQPLP